LLPHWICHGRYVAREEDHSSRARERLLSYLARHITANVEAVTREAGDDRRRNCVVRLESGRLRLVRETALACESREVLRRDQTLCGTVKADEQHDLSQAAQ